MVSMMYFFFLCLLQVLEGSVVMPNQMKLVQDLLESYDKKSKPTWDNNNPINVTFSMSLYQILELNEPQQYILLNAWIIERWHDEFLYWNPLDYGNITEMRLPHDSIWKVLPDTTLYNSLVMKDDDTRRLLNAKLTTNLTRKAALIELLYPTIYKFSCLLNLKFFPFDIQVCTMTFSSWTYDSKGIDYLPHDNKIGTASYLENEGWYLMKTTVKRKEVKYACCPNAYTLLKMTLYLRRKPLFYLVNLIIPTSIITLIAIVGFFTTSSASGMREEKVSLGITTLLSMSILMLMVSDQMPTTSTFIPLIGWFILGMIMIISLGTLASSVIIAIQKRGRLGERLSSKSVKLTKFFGALSLSDVPLHLRIGTKEYYEAHQPLFQKNSLGRTPSSKSPRPIEKRSKLINVLKSNLSPNNQTGAMGSLVVDRSTDLLMAHSLPPDELSKSPSYNEENKQREKELRKASSPIVLNMGLHDDEISQGESETMETSRPITTRSRLPSQSGLFAQLFNDSALRQNRQLAVKEYEWLATVVERCCFIIFVVLFIIVTSGINLIGYLHWITFTFDEKSHVED